MDYFPDNKLLHYTTKLPKNFKLLGELEVGLFEIQFPVSWCNVGKDEAILFYGAPGIGNTYKNISPPYGLYDNPETLIKQINAAITLTDDKQHLKFVYNEIFKKVSIHYAFSAKGRIYLKMSTRLAEILGFEWEKRDANLDRGHREDHVPLERWIALMESVPLGSTRAYDSRFMLDSHGLVDLYFISVNPNDKGVLTGGNVCDLQRGFYSLLVYCDIIEETVVGDSKVPILRIVNINGK